MWPFWASAELPECSARCSTLLVRTRVTPCPAWVWHLSRSQQLGTPPTPILWLLLCTRTGPVRPETPGHSCVDFWSSFSVRSFISGVCPSNSTTFASLNSGLCLVISTGGLCSAWCPHLCATIGTLSPSDRPGWVWTSVLCAFLFPGIFFLHFPLSNVWKWFHIYICPVLQFLWRAGYLVPATSLWPEAKE